MLSDLVMSTRWVRFCWIFMIGGEIFPVINGSLCFFFSKFSSWLTSLFLAQVSRFWLGWRVFCVIYLYFLTGSVNEIKFSLLLCEKTHLWCFFFFFSCWNKKTWNWPWKSLFSSKSLEALNQNCTRIQ